MFDLDTNELVLVICFLAIAYMFVRIAQELPLGAW
jgi:hypothetical protein